MTPTVYGIDTPVQPAIVGADEAFVADYERGLERTAMADNAWRRPRFFNMLQVFRLTRGVEGATAEAGVYRGLASYLLCRERARETPGFDGTGHVGVDSFEGLGAPSPADANPANTNPDYEGRFADTSLETARRTLADFPGVTLVQGWIPDAFEHLPEQAYRFVHVDVDLHAPTRDGLAYFYPRLSPGGMIVVDDYGPWPNGEFPGCKAAVDDFATRHGLAMATLDTGNAVLIKR